MNIKQNKKIVIVGGGTAGWMAANLFTHHWQNEAIEITLVESPDVGIIGVGEGSTPTLKHFFNDIGVTEHEWMSRCNATYKTNIIFKGWSPKSGIEQYSHPFPTQPDTFTSRSFMVNCRTRRLGLDTRTLPDDFLLNSTLAQQGKGPIAPENFPFQIEYGYHFDSQLLGEFLSELARKRGVSFKQAHVTNVKRAESGDISSLVTDLGEEIQADFFIDCTGFSSILMQKVLGVKFNSYKENLFNDAAVVMPTEISETIPSYTLSSALSAGWAWKIPLTNRFGNGYVYSSDFITSEQAEQEFRKHLDLLDSNETCKHLKMKVGQLEQHWSHNCLGLGLSQGFIEPLEATALHLVQISTQTFIEKFKQGSFTNKYQKEFNRDITHKFERIRDYIVAHYKLNTRDDSDYWRANRENNHLSDELMAILERWYKREDMIEAFKTEQLKTEFDATSWHCLLAGYGAFPPLNPNQPDKGCLYQEKNVANFIKGCALNFSSHHKNLKC